MPQRSDQHTVYIFFLRQPEDSLLFAHAPTMALSNAVCIHWHVQPPLRQLNCPAPFAKLIYVTDIAFRVTISVFSQTTSRAVTICKTCNGLPATIPKFSVICNQKTDKPFTLFIDFLQKINQQPY
jgi:hypothetical protein